MAEVNMAEAMDLLKIVNSSTFGMEHLLEGILVRWNNPYQFTPGLPAFAIREETEGIIEKLKKWREEYAKKPKHTLRPWTAKEWGARIGERFLFEGRQYQLNKIFNPDYLEFHDVQSPVMQLTADLTLKNATQRITQLDGSPCGVFEEVKG